MPLYLIVSIASTVSWTRNSSAIDCHEKRKILTNTLHTALRRSSFHLFPKLDLLSMLLNFSATSHALFQNAPRSSNSPMTSSIPSSTSGTCEDFPLILIPSPSPETTLQYHLSGP